MKRPILYSFRRCPYAMRARLAIQSAGISCDLREIVLRDKAPEFLTTSPKGTVPVLDLGNQVIEESFDIMQWALGQNDPEHWLEMPNTGFSWIAEADGPFKTALDHTKYATRYPDVNAHTARQTAAAFLMRVDAQLGPKKWLFGDQPTLADMALLPFIRQFANIDRNWFDSRPWPHLIAWLDRFLSSERFAAIMKKYPKWVKNDPITEFPDPSAQN